MTWNYFLSHCQILDHSLKQGRNLVPPIVAIWQPASMSRVIMTPPHRSKIRGEIRAVFTQAARSAPPQPPNFLFMKDVTLSRR
jgi:hypothetical protein